MNFFITNHIGMRSSGIEHSQLKRLQLFSKFNEPAITLSTMAYARLHEDYAENHLDKDHRLNLFDYYAHTTDIPAKAYGLTQFLADNHIPSAKAMGEERTPDHRIALGYLAKFENGRQGIIRVDKATQVLNSVAYADAAGTLLGSDIYDSRGFKYAHYTIDPKTKLRTEQTQFDLLGREVLHFYYTDTPTQPQTLKRITLQTADEQHTFSSVRALETHFFDQVNRDFGLNNLFISDRYEVTPSLGDMRTPAKKYVYIHNIFTVIPEEPDYPELNYNYAYGIEHNDLFDGLIVPTAHEKTDLLNRFSFKKPVHVVPSGYIEQMPTKKTISERHPAQVLSVARIDVQKRMDQLIRVFAIAHQSVPDARLKIAGYVTQDAVYQMLQQVIEETGMKDYVDFLGYVDPAKVYDESVALVWTSRGEGFGLALIEALSHGVPLIAYDINYGPNEIVADGVNGYLVKSGDIESMAEKLTLLLKDQFLQQKLSTAAYESSQKFSAKAVWAQWQAVLNGGKQA